MSLVKCSECNKEISDKATSCPNCGFPIIQKEITNNIIKDTQNFKNPTVVIKESPKVVVSKEGCFLQTMNLGCVIIIIIVVLFIIIALASPK